MNYSMITSPDFSDMFKRPHLLSYVLGQCWSASMGGGANVFVFIKHFAFSRLVFLSHCVACSGRRAVLHAIGKTM